jgi:hypothetical protein
LNITYDVKLNANIRYEWNHETTIYIPDAELEEAMGFSKARSKREAIVTALMDINRRRRMAALIRQAGTCAGFASADEVRSLRRKG